MTARAVRSLDFVISNDGHHPAMFEPVIRSLMERSDLKLRVISLCEFRGLLTPSNSIHPSVDVHSIMPFRFRRASTGGQSDTFGSRRRRDVARRLSWFGLLQPGIRRWLRSKPDLVVLPNDAAFPYDRIAGLLRERAIPFVLVQEGIRFELPLQDGDSYGKNGAVAIAAWGESSEEFFQRQGVPRDRIHMTGSPRHDVVWQTDWNHEGEGVRNRLGLGKKILLLLTNPIDDQGFCTTSEKLALFSNFLREIEPLFSDPEFTLVVKLHGRESEQSYFEIKDRSRHSKRIHILQRTVLYPLFAISGASLIYASTAGLEAMMVGCPVGIIEIPGHGFVHDYVSSGAAEGLHLDGNTAARIQSLFEPNQLRADRISGYVRRSLSCRGCAAEKVAELLTECLGESRWN